MNATGGFRNLQRQLVGVGALQLTDAPVLKDDTGQVVVVREFLEDVFCRRWLTLGRLVKDGQSEFPEQNFLQLLRAAEVEWSTGVLVRQRFQRSHRFRECAALLFQHAAIEQYTGFFHAEEDGNQRLLDIFVDGLKRWRLL